MFWSSQALTWVIIPLTEAYFSAGDFSFGQKMKTSLRENAIVYGSALVIFFIVLVYISVKVCILLSFAEICRKLTPTLLALGAPRERRAKNCHCYDVKYVGTPRADLSARVSALG